MIETTIMATRARVRESRIQPLFFDALEPDGSNYLNWSVDIRTYLRAEELDVTLEVEPEKEIPAPYKWQTLMILRRHLDTSLRQQYI
jgi:hypothetical protein